MVVVASGVVQRRERVALPRSQHLRIDFLSQCIHIFLIRPRHHAAFVVFKRHLLGAAQTVQAHVLCCAPGGVAGKSVHRAVGLGHASPSRVLRASVGVHAALGQTALEGFLAVLQHIFADVTQLDVQVAARVVRVAVGQERIHHPELDVFDVGALKIGILQFAHDAAPARLRIGQLTVRTYLVRHDVILTTLRRIVGQVHHAHTRVGIGQILAVGVDLRLQNHTYTLVASGICVVADMGGRVG